MTQPEEQQANEEQYLTMLRKIDPELYLIKISLMQTGVNPMILPRVIRMLGNLDIGSGFGEITILMKARRITQIKGSESDVLNMPVDNQSGV